MIVVAALQLRGAVPSTPLELITGATTLTKGVLIILAVLSLLSWAIMFALWRELARAQRTSLKFFRDFERASRLEEAGALAKVTAPNALTRLFMRAAHFVSDTRVRNQQAREREAG
jgi:biopolymer transport protein ExbB/TolQ